MSWDKQVEDAKDELGYGNRYLEPHEWEEVVETAKHHIEQECEADYQDHLYRYKEYINSLQWAMKRAQRLEMDGRICQDCKGEAHHVHHITYDRLGRENMNDLVSLCSSCHKRRHGFVRRVL